jgi:hypothetical protein
LDILSYYLISTETLEMTEDTKDPVDGVQVEKRSSDDIEKANEKASHEGTKSVPTWIPEDDSQYEVTFKTWIVISVRPVNLVLLRVQPPIRNV